MCSQHAVLLQLPALAACPQAVKDSMLGHFTEKA